MNDEIVVSLEDWNNRNEMIVGMDTENKDLHALLKEILDFPEDDKRRYIIDVYREAYKRNQNE